jgi:hypothetical protein
MYDTVTMYYLCSLHISKEAYQLLFSIAFDCLRVGV